MIDLSKKDRLVLINQYRILAALNRDEESYYFELIEILERGYSIFYTMIDEWVSDDIPVCEGRFVLSILDLYRAIEDVKRSTRDENLLKHSYAFFRGFDGNNETEYMGFCRFLIEKQGKYQEQKKYLLKNDNLNSHMPMKDKYQRMLEAAKQVGDIWNMTAQQAITILNA